MIDKIGVLGEVSGACWILSRAEGDSDVSNAWERAGADLTRTLLELGAQFRDCWTADREQLVTLAAAAVNLILAGDRLDTAATTTEASA